MFLRSKRENLKTKEGERIKERRISRTKSSPSIGGAKLGLLTCSEEVQAKKIK